MLVKAVLLACLVTLGESNIQTSIVEQWWGGFKFKFTITPCNGAVESWNFHIKLSSTIDGIECDWAASAQGSGNDWTLTNIATDGHIDAGGSFSDVCVVRCGGACQGAGPYSYTFTSSDDCGGSSGVITQAPTQAPGGHETQAPGGNTGGSNVGGTVPTGGGKGNKNYADALKKAVLFYDAQRSGKLPANNPIPWRGDSAMGDCVVGGWYDAGDHVKFGLPFGAATHVLLWGLYKFKDGFASAGALDSAYDMIKWATDYMLKAYNSGTHELVAQIGDGDADHSYWGPPEQMTMNRPCYKVGPGKAAAELYGEWAASLAATSLVFRSKDASYADKCLEAAKSMYAFGKSNRGTYGNSIPNIGRFYGSSGDKDEMCLGAMWLYRATKTASYLNDAKTFHQGNPAWALSWDDKNVACQLLLFEETKDNSYKSEVEAFLHDWMPGGSVAYTPCGLAWRDKWGSNRYAGNAAFVALAAADDGIQAGAGTKWALEQLNYLLGDNHQQGGCFSFMIGYGSKFPQHPHHRAASSTGGHQLNGALVGGPDNSGGHYEDSQGNYVTNEVAIDYNSGFTAALAGVNHFISKGGLPATNNKCAC